MGIGRPLGPTVCRYCHSQAGDGMAKDETTTKGRGRVAGSVGYFDRTAEVWASQYDQPTVGGHVLRERRDRVMALLEGRSGTLLDVGCGSCVLAADFVARGFDYWGVDAAYRMVERGRAALEAVNGRACAADTTGLPFPDASFDAVVCLGVIDRVPDPDRAAAEMARVVKPGGVILTSFLNRWSPYYAWRLGVFYPAVRMARSALAAAGRRSAAPGLATRAWRFRPRSVERLFADPDLSLVATSYYNYNVLLPPLDELFPRTAARVAARLSVVDASRLRSLGGAFVAAVARAPTDRP